jgi:glycine/D-amino acid oxidase-like deaminating enzyme
MAPDYDVVIVGGGFFGCCLALHLSSITDRVLVLEDGERLLERASRVNQARVHTGFHYPRSFATALRSRILQERFVRDFGHAVVDDFDMLYAIAARRSKVSASRFEHTFASLDAPFSPAPPNMRALFNPELIEGVFRCREFAFDWTALRSGLLSRLDAYRLPVWTGQRATRIRSEPDRAVVELEGGREITADTVFNVTYANINHLLLSSGVTPMALKHELAEVALAAPPPEMKGAAVTVMDGPFFSTMPYPSEKLFSFTHVRYTPHYSWVDGNGDRSPYRVAEQLPRQTRWRHMVQDAQRYLPCAAQFEYQTSLFEVKTVMVKNERDDGRPILLRRHADAPRLVSVMGAKIDNIYDLFEALPQLDPRWRDARPDRLLG